jgi:hypothetical protein
MFIFFQPLRLMDNIRFEILLASQRLAAEEKSWAFNWEYIATAGAHICPLLAASQR